MHRLGDVAPQMLSALSVRGAAVYDPADAVRALARPFPVDLNGAFNQVTDLSQIGGVVFGRMLAPKVTVAIDGREVTLRQPKVRKQGAGFHRLAALGRPAWIRFVLVPGLTDRPDNVSGLARFCGDLSNVERVEVVPFHQLGRLKWRDLGLDYSLERVEPPTDEQLQSVRDTFRRFGSICPD